MPAEALDGSAVRMPGDTLSQVVVLDFWATWCRLCVASMRHFKQVRDAYRDGGEVIIGVNTDVP